jgi:hypothetical protein
MSTALFPAEPFLAGRTAAGVAHGFVQGTAVAGAQVDGAPPGAPVN